MSKLKDRIEGYISATDYKLLNKLPVIININGRGFLKTTSLLDKPFCEKFSECMLSTALRLCNDIDGAIFAYQHNDEITIISRNDQNMDTNPWFDNKIQKLCSVTASLATSHFYECYNKLNLSFLNDPLFTSQIFAVPTYSEAVNTILYKQHSNFYTSVQYACYYELMKKYEKNNIKEMISGLSVDDKINLLFEECNINFNDYPKIFKRGAAIYKAPNVINGNIKNKWIINEDLPIFNKNQAFISNILKNGLDIFGDIENEKVL